MQAGQFNHVKTGSPWLAVTKARSLPPEIDNEGNIEYKVILCPAFKTYLYYFQLNIDG